MFLNKKHLFIFLFILFFILIFSKNVFATGFSEIDDTELNNLISICFTYMQDNNIDTSIFTKCFTAYRDNSLKFYFLTNNSSYFIIDNLVDVNNCFAVYLDSSDYSVVGFTDDLDNSIHQRSLNGNYYWECLYSNSLVYSNFDFYYYDSETIAFESNKNFFLPPLTGVIVQKIQGENLEVVLKEIIKILPLTIVVVVSFLGLHKALALLLAILHKA